MRLVLVVLPSVLARKGEGKDKNGRAGKRKGRKNEQGKNQKKATHYLKFKMHTLLCLIKYIYFPIPALRAPLN